MNIEDIFTETRNELAIKSKADIERETAVKWYTRALVAYENYMNTKDSKWMVNAIEYKHEAIEHAAESLDDDLYHTIKTNLHSVMPW